MSTASSDLGATLLICCMVAMAAAGGESSSPGMTRVEKPKSTPPKAAEPRAASRVSDLGGVHALQCTAACAETFHG